MIPYGRQNISQHDIDAVVEVLKSDFLTQGPMVPRFEQRVADYTGADHCVAVNSATSALHIACLSLGLGPGDTLWTTPNTFVASANCALYCGATVDFVDIDPKTYNLCPVKLEEKLIEAKKKNKLPKIVIPVHFAGQSCEMEKIYNLSKIFGFSIIEDASHAIGSDYLGEKVGSCKYSHISVFSFHPVKIITSGEGGMALTNDSMLAEKMERLRSHGISTDISSFQNRSEEEIWNYQQIDLGFNYRMTDMQAALGLSQMDRLDHFVGLRRALSKKYDEKLSGVVITPWQSPTGVSSYHLYPVRIHSKFNKQKDVYSFMRKNGVGVNVHYIPVHRQPYFERLGFELGSFPEAECFHQEVITLPLYPDLSEKSQQYVIDKLMEAVS